MTHEEIGAIIGLLAMFILLGFLMYALFVEMDYNEELEQEAVKRGCAEIVDGEFKWKEDSDEN